MAESSHQRALNLAEKLLEKGKERQDQLKEEGRLTSAILGYNRDLASIATALEEDGRVKNFGETDELLQDISDLSTLLN